MNSSSPFPPPRGPVTPFPTKDDPKKPIWKRWWAITAAVLVGLIILAGAFGGGKTEETSAPPASEEPVTSIDTPEPPSPSFTPPIETTTTTEVPTTTEAPATTTSAVPEITTPSSCVELSRDEVALIIGEGAEANWIGNGEFALTSAFRAPVTKDMPFRWVFYLQGDAPGMPQEVFTFATDYDGVSSFLIVGADALTREFWVWGADIGVGSPILQAVTEAAQSAERCID